MSTVEYSSPEAPALWSPGRRAKHPGIIGANRDGFQLGYMLALAEAPFTLVAAPEDMPMGGSEAAAEAIKAGFPAYSRDGLLMERLVPRDWDYGMQALSECAPLILCPGRNGSSPSQALSCLAALAVPSRPLVVVRNGVDALSDGNWRDSLPGGDKACIFGFHLPAPGYASRLVELDVPAHAPEAALAVAEDFCRTLPGKSVLRRDPGSTCVAAALHALEFCAAFAVAGRAGIPAWRADKAIGAAIHLHGPAPFARAESAGPADLLCAIRTLPQSWRSTTPEIRDAERFLEGVLSQPDAGKGFRFMAGKSSGTPTRGCDSREEQALPLDMLVLLLDWLKALGLDGSVAAPDRVFLSGLGWRNPPQILRRQLRDEARSGALDRESRFRQANGLKTKLAVFPDATLWDAGDRIGFLELHGNRNCLGASSMHAIRESVAAAETSLDGLLIGSFARHFCLGVDLAQVLLEIANHEWESVAGAMASLQNSFQSIRYACVPVWAYLHSLSLGGGCELAMHCSGVSAAEGTVLGLPEARIGLIPVGGGLKELAARSMRIGSASERLERLRRYYRQAASGRLAFTPQAAADAGLLPPDARWLSAHDGFSRSKRSLLASRTGFRPKVRGRIPWELGQEALDALMSERESLQKVGCPSPAQWAAAERIALVMSLEGRKGDAFADEESFLDLERKFSLQGLQTKEAQAGMLAVMGLADGK